MPEYRIGDNVVVRGRWEWKAMPWGMHTRCAVCGEHRYCHGRTRDRMVCLACFSDDARAVKLRRGGKPGKRARYEYRARPKKADQIALAHALRQEGHGLMEIGSRLGRLRGATRVEEDGPELPLDVPTRFAIPVTMRLYLPTKGTPRVVGRPRSA